MKTEEDFIEELHRKNKNYGSKIFWETEYDRLLGVLKKVNLNDLKSEATKGLISTCIYWADYMQKEYGSDLTDVYNEFSY